MRLKILFALIVLIAFANGRIGRKHCHPKKQSCRGSIGRLPPAKLSTEEKKTLDTTVKVVGDLAGGVGSLTAKVLEIDPAKFAKVLKCLSTIGEIINLFIEVENSNTKQIIDEIHHGFDKLSNQLTYQLANLKMSISQQLLDVEVFVPVDAAVYQMNMLINMGTVSDPTSQIDFLKTFDMGKLNLVVRNMRQRAQERFVNIFEATNYNRTIFNVTMDTMAQVFVQTFAVRAFRLGILGNETSAMESLLKEYNYERSLFEKMIREATDHYFANFFPGTAEARTVKTLIDKYAKNGTCYIAAAIRDELRASYPWRAFTVIVTDGKSGDRYYFHVGQPNRKIVVEDYNGKNAVVFMSSLNFTENAMTYDKNNYRAEIKNLGRFHHYPPQLQELTKFIVQRNSGYQVFVTWNNAYHHCLEQSHPKANDAFTAEVLEPVTDRDLEFYLVVNN